MEKLSSTLANIEAARTTADNTQTSSSSDESKADWPLPIPSPPGYPFLGNIPDVDTELPLSTFMHLADIYGPIYSMRFGSTVRTFISSAELLEEACDETRFRKIVTGSLCEVRNGAGSGLFTAHHGEKDWEIAHRILMPAFGPLSIRNMFDDMHDIASQLVMKWARYGPQNRILATDDFTRLTLDTLALCTMDYRFNSFYTEQMHPFIDAMGDFLVESGRRANRPVIAQMFMRGTNQKYESDIKLLQDLSRDVIEHRRKNPKEGKKDLLNAMINGRDPKTGEGMRDDLIIANMITFLIAGHETTSGLLSFVFYNLITNSAAYRAAQKEVDEVCGKGPITVEHMPKLKYIAAVLRETLRLNPTAPLFATCLHPELDENPTTIGKGKYRLPKGEPIVAVLPKVHRDPKVYGDDAEKFRPERMLDENFNKLPPAAWKPFGNGMRACIGRPFAWQEALLVTAMLLQHFNFTLDDPNYQLRLKQTLTIKPKDFYMHATLRDGMDPTQLEKSLAGSIPVTPSQKQTTSPEKQASVTGGDKTQKPMSIFFGSNTGTCEALAQRLATNAASHGFDAAVGPLDAATDKLPKDHPVVIITASYEGQPPDNAAHFVEWLKSLAGDEAAGTSYAVFGCGHSDWASTFHRVPNLVDDLLSARGATRLVKRGLADASQGDMFTEFDTWEDTHFWPSITSNFGGISSPSTPTTSPVTVEISSSTRSTNLRTAVRKAEVLSTLLLSAPGEPEKRHIEIQLPSEMPYRTGDYLAVLPINPIANIRRALKRFQLPWDAQITISSTAPTHLPVGHPMSAHDVFASYVELAQPASKKNISTLAAFADGETKSALEALLGDGFATEITATRTSPLDLLERYPELPVPLGTFLALLPPMRVRQYSISSSPLVSPNTCTLTYSLPSSHTGVATSYLASLDAGTALQVAVRQSSQKFHLPLDPSVPIVMVAAGTGLAPFRGFVQERAIQKAAGRKLGRTLLFVGCRGATRDCLYKEEFEAWEREGVVEMRYAFSREPENERAQGCKYVQDRLRKEKTELVEVWEAGARVYVCGNAAVGEEVGKVCRELYEERVKEKGEVRSTEEIEEWFAGVKEERFATDVFA